MLLSARAYRLVVTAAAIAAFAWPAAARGDAVTDWNGYANAAIFSTGPAAHSAALSTAMVQGAVYDAVNAIAGGYRPYLPTPRANPPTRRTPRPRRRPSRLPWRSSRRRRRR